MIRSALSQRTTRLLIIALLLTLAMGFCYTKVQPIDSRWHNQILDWFRELRQLESVLNQEILRVRYWDRLDYDFLVTSVQDIKNSHKQLLEAVANLVEGSDVVQAVQKYELALRTNEQLVDHFKSHHAVLKNSRRYLPLVTAELRQALPQGAEEIRMTLEALLRNILLSDLQPELAIEAFIQKDRIAGLEVQAPSAIATSLFYIKLHAGTVLREQSKVDSLVERLLRPPKKDFADFAFNAYINHFNKREACSKHYLSLLIFFATLLVLNVLYLILGYARLAKTLALNNESLEHKVIQRTKALHHLNQSLQKELAERARVEEEVQHSESRYQSLTQTALDAIITADSKGNILSWNRGATLMFGASEKQVIGQSLTRFMPERYRLAHSKGLDRYHALGVSKLKGKPFEMAGLNVDGSEFPLELALTSWVSRGQRYFGGILRDITDHKKAERALREAKEEAETANRLKSTFLANMSHEIRTPMNAVLGYAQILLGSQDLAAHHREAARVIDTAGEHLLALISEILDISKIESGKMALNALDFDLIELIEGLSDLFKSQCLPKGISFQLNSTLGAHKRVHGDQGKLRQVLINLISNAIKFSNFGDTVEFMVCYQGAGYKFEVRDYGPGISPKDQTFLFKPFEQGQEGEKKGGTGLGLAIAKRQVELMGGQLELKSILGQGSRFFFDLLLPAAQGPVLERKRRLSGARHKRLASSCHVLALVVDDIEDNRTVLSTILQMAGIEVQQASQGKEALEMLHKQRADIVFMDIRMPVMGGMEAFGHMNQQFYPPIPCVVVSASSLVHERAYYRQEGFDDFIPKPFRVEAVMECIYRLLDVQFEDEGCQEETDKAIQAAKTIAILDGINLPQSLVNRLRRMAELGAVTGVSELLKEMTELGEAPAALSNSLMPYLAVYDMDGFLKVLEEAIGK